MKINRHNYEEYFILYMDNELNREDKNMVDLFIQQNPDLEEELIMLQQSKLVADGSVVFGNKETLMRPVNDLVNLSNYEEWLLLYNDNELTTEQKIAVEEFIDKHPQAKTELEVLQRAKLQPEENIVFTNKESLYRREEKVRVIAIKWWRIAAAAALLFAVSITAFLFINQQKATETGIANGGIQETIQDNNATKKVDENNNPNTLSQVIADVNENKGASNNIAPVRNTKTSKSERLPIQVNEKNAEAIVASVDEKNKNDLAEPTYNPNMKRPLEETNAVAGIDIPSIHPLTKQKQNISVQNVTPEFTSTLQPTDETMVDAGQNDKKITLRGLIRKVTRTFEKTTNIKATDDEDRLLVGGLAIKL